MKMVYPDDFIAECKRVYPDWIELHAKLAEGSEMVGRYLDDSRTTGVSFDAVLAATSLESLQDYARAQRERQILYQHWTSLYWVQKEKRP